MPELAITVLAASYFLSKLFLLYDVADFLGLKLNNENSTHQPSAIIHRKKEPDKVFHFRKYYPSCNVFQQKIFSRKLFSTNSFPGFEKKTCAEFWTKTRRWEMFDYLPRADALKKHAPSFERGFFLGKIGAEMFDIFSHRFFLIFTEGGCFEKKHAPSFERGFFF